MRTKDIVLIGMLSALLFAAQIGLAFLPNVELVSLLVIIYTLTLRKKTLFIITIFILLEGFLYGFGIWWINYLYIWFILYFITTLSREKRSPLVWALISGAYGLSFGALCTIPNFFIGSVNLAVSSSFFEKAQFAFIYWINGIPYDLIHGISNFVITLFLFNPLFTIMNLLTKNENIT